MPPAKFAVEAVGVGWFLFFAVLLFFAARLFEPTSPLVYEELAPKPPPRQRLRTCPFCGGRSRYMWVPGREGGHRATCSKCGEVYSVNLGGQTRWAIIDVEENSEVCWLPSDEMEVFARDFFSRARPSAAVQGDTCR
jgi:hypothetical protein